MLTASARYKIQSAFIDTFICGRSLRSSGSLSISVSVSLFLLDPIGRNVFVGLIYLCRNICMYMEPTLYPLLPRGLFTKRACTGIHAYEIMYVVVRLYMCLTSRIDTNVGVWSGQPNFPSRLIHVIADFFSQLYIVLILISIKLMHMHSKWYNETYQSLICAERANFLNANTLF